jgi:Holliday junction resolvase RusA-like endonuclease
MKDKEKISRMLWILDNIQKDLADYQKEKGIGMMDDAQWQQLFIERMVANVADYKNFEALSKK